MAMRTTQKSPPVNKSVRADRSRSSGVVDPPHTALCDTSSAVGPRATPVYISSDEDDFPPPRVTPAKPTKQSHSNGGRSSTVECHPVRLNDCWDTDDIDYAPTLGEGALIDDGGHYHPKYYGTSRLAAQHNILNRTRENCLANAVLALEFPPDFGFRIEQQVPDYTDEEEEMLKSLRGDPSFLPTDGIGSAYASRPIVEHYVFEPTPEVYSDFGKMIEEIQQRGAHRNGVIKIKVPKECIRNRPMSSRVKTVFDYTPDEDQPDEDVESGWPCPLYSSDEEPPPLRRSSIQERKSRDKRNAVSDPDITVYKQRVFSHPRSICPSINPLFFVETHVSESAPSTMWLSAPDNYPNLPLPTTEHRFIAWADDGSSTVDPDTDDWVWYSSDNAATTDLRNRFGLSDPGLDKLTGNTLTRTKNTIEGIHTPYLYFARKFTTFALHHEDYSALSINYLHIGAPKRWIVIAPWHAIAVENLIDGLTNSTFTCSQFVRHESVFVPTKTLRTAGIAYTQVEQKEGELVVTFPYAYHQGWNVGVNCAEAVGFADERWWRDVKGRDYSACRRGCPVEPIRLEWED